MMFFTLKGYEIFHDPGVIDMVGVRQGSDGEITFFDTVEQAIEYVLVQKQPIQPIWPIQPSIRFCKNCGQPIGTSHSSYYCDPCFSIITLGNP